MVDSAKCGLNPFQEDRATIVVKREEKQSKIAETQTKIFADNDAKMKEYTEEEEEKEMYVYVRIYYGGNLEKEGGVL